MNSNALAYLLRTKIRNRLKEFFKKPIRLIYVVILIALIVMTLIGGKSGAEEADRVVRSFKELTAGLNVLLILIFTITFNSGLNNGGSFFRMPDVNFLFPSPLNKRSILFYALIQQIGTSMLIGIFILFQYTMLHVTYNLSYLGLLLIFIVYSLTVFLSQTTAMFMYTLISDSDKKRRLVKTVLYLVIVILAAYVGLIALSNRSDILGGLTKAVSGLPVLLFPFAGWMGGLAESIFTGNFVRAAVWFAVCAVAFTAILAAMSKSKRDYYEDVLASTETLQSALMAAKDGVAPEISPRVIKVGKTGLGKGQGSSVFFYKHLLENRRASKIWIKPMSLTFIIMTVIFSVFMRKGGIIPAFSFSIYMMVFSVALGRFNRELTKPYIYLVPEAPLKKLGFALAESLPTELMESILVLVPVSIITNTDALTCAFCIIARVSFAALFLASNVAIERIWGSALSKVGGMFIYLLFDILLCLPGIALAFILQFNGVNILNFTLTLALSITVMNLPIAALVLFCCRNVLQYAETK